MKISKGLQQAYQVQDFTHSALMAMKEDLSKEGKLTLTRDDATAISHLVRAWQAAQERIRIHRNKPLPGTVKPQAKAPKTSGLLLEVVRDAEADAAGQ
jgi:hypothetical protein